MASGIPCARCESATLFTAAALISWLRSIMLSPRVPGVAFYPWFSEDQLASVERFRVLARRTRLHAAQSHDGGKGIRREPALVLLTAEAPFYGGNLPCDHALRQVHEEVR